MATGHGDHFEAAYDQTADAVATFLEDAGA